MSRRLLSSYYVYELQRATDPARRRSEACTYRFRRPAICHRRCVIVCARGRRCCFSFCCHRITVPNICEYQYGCGPTRRAAAATRNACMPHFFAKRTQKFDASVANTTHVRERESSARCAPRARLSVGCRYRCRARGSQPREERAITCCATLSLGVDRAPKCRARKRRTRTTMHARQKARKKGERQRRSSRR